MPQPQTHAGYIARQLASLSLCGVSVQNPMVRVRAAAWHNQLHRLGVSLPLFVVADLGVLLTSGATVGVSGTARRQVMAQNPDVAPLLADYDRLLGEIANGEMVEAARALGLRDEMVAVILHRLLREIHRTWPQRLYWVHSGELPLDPGIYGDAAAEVGVAEGGQPEFGLVRHMLDRRLYLLTAVEQIDLDTLRLMGLFSGNDGAGLDLADLMTVFASPQANDVVNFSLDLLPSVLETRRQSGVQTFSIDGYASIERHGSVDSVVLSEFALDDDIFELKVYDNELYYYGHEKERKEQRRLQYILVDSSASMRGVREVFARGLALTLLKKLSLQGDEVWLRFFDSRLYETIQAERGAVPHLLCFRSERGRNYGRVFSQLLLELQRLHRQDGRAVVLTIITHGQCHLSNALVEKLRIVAHLYGVFILPSQTLHLDYLHLLHGHQIVTREALSNRDRSVDRAREILDDVEEQGDRADR